MPHVHLLLGITGVNILAYWGQTSYHSIYFLLGSVFPDIDSFFNLLIKKNSHRQLLTHFPLVYLVTAFFFGIWGHMMLFWFFIGALIHVLVDIWDWEIFILAPLSSKSFSLLNLDYAQMSEKRSFVAFIQKYYQNRKIVVLELLAFGICILSLIL